jgi:hypothetical protein
MPSVVRLPITASGTGMRKATAKGRANIAVESVEKTDNG